MTVPDDRVITEVPHGGHRVDAPAATSFTSTIERARGRPTAAGRRRRSRRRPDGTGPALDDDKINLMQWTLEQQKIDAAMAQRDLDAARSQLVVVQPGPLPTGPEGVNVALFAKQSTNAVGQSIYPALGRGAGRRASATAAATATPTRRSAPSWPAAARRPTGYGLDPDGDGFACNWDPAPYRALQLSRRRSGGAPAGSRRRATARIVRAA